MTRSFVGVCLFHLLARKRRFFFDDVHGYDKQLDEAPKEGKSLSDRLPASDFTSGEEGVRGEQGAIKTGTHNKRRFVNGCTLPLFSCPVESCAAAKRRAAHRPSVPFLFLCRSAK